MSESMVERVRKVVEVMLYEYGDSTKHFQSDQIARAALEAMREPTDEMIDAAPEEGVSWNDDSRGYAANYWKSMIDAALTPAKVDEAE